MTNPSGGKRWVESEKSIAQPFRIRYLDSDPFGQ